MTEFEETSRLLPVSSLRDWQALLRYAAIDGAGSLAGCLVTIPSLGNQHLLGLHCAFVVWARLRLYKPSFCIPGGSEDITLR